MTLEKVKKLVKIVSAVLSVAIRVSVIYLTVHSYYFKKDILDAIFWLIVASALQLSDILKNSKES